MGYLSRKSAKQMTSNKEDLFYYKGKGMLRPELETLCTFGEFVCLPAYWVHIFVLTSSSALNFNLQV